MSSTATQNFALLEAVYTLQETLLTISANPRLL